MVFRKLISPGRLPQKDHSFCDQFAVPKRFVLILVQNNLIEIVDGRTDQTFLAQAIRIEGVKAAIIRDNVIGLQQPNPNRNFRCGTVTYFNNKTPAGELIQGFDGDDSTTYTELESDAEEALLFSLI